MVKRVSEGEGEGRERESEGGEMRGCGMAMHSPRYLYPEPPWTGRR